MSDLVPGQEKVEGPDVERAHATKEMVKTMTIEVDIVLAEQRRLAKTLQKVGKRNHFADRFREILRGRA